MFYQSFLCVNYVRVDNQFFVCFINNHFSKNLELHGHVPDSLPD